MDKEIVIAHAKPDELERVWADVQKFFKGTDRYRYQQFSPDEVLCNLKEGALLFVVIDGAEIIGACVASVEETKTGGRSLFIPIMGGVDFSKWYEKLADFLEEIAKANNCKTIEYIGRKGFSKLDSSYVEDGRIYVKEIE